MRWFRIEELAYQIFTGSSCAGYSTDEIKGALKLLGEEWTFDWWMSTQVASAPNEQGEHEPISPK